MSAKDGLSHEAFGNGASFWGIQLLETDGEGSRDPYVYLMPYTDEIADFGPRECLSLHSSSQLPGLLPQPHNSWYKKSGQAIPPHVGAVKQRKDGPNLLHPRRGRC